MPVLAHMVSSRARFWLGIATFQIGLILLTVYVSLSRWQSGQVEISQRLQELDRLRGVAAYRSRLAQPDHSDVFASAFLADQPPAILSADEITTLKSWASSAGIELQAANPLSPRQEGAITWVGVSVQATGKWPSFLQLLRQIETSEPVLVLDKLILRSTVPPELQQQSDAILVFQADVTGAARSKESKPVEGNSQ